MINLVPYMLGAGIVGIVHMLAPDHWVTLCVLGRTEGWTRARLFAVSLKTGIGHVALSVALGLGVVALGTVFSNLISFYLNFTIGIVMVVVGLIVGVRPLMTKNNSTHNHENGQLPHALHDDHHRLKEDNGKKVSGKLTHGIGYFAVLGAVLSPDPSITPIFLAAIPAGFHFALDLALIFATASILTLVLLVQLGSAGLAKIFGIIPQRYNDSLVGFVIVAIGNYVLVAG